MFLVTCEYCVYQEVHQYFVEQSLDRLQWNIRGNETKRCTDVQAIEPYQRKKVQSCFWHQGQYLLNSESPAGTVKRWSWIGNVLSPVIRKKVKHICKSVNIKAACPPYKMIMVMKVSWKCFRVMFIRLKSSQFSGVNNALSSMVHTPNQSQQKRCFRRLFMNGWNRDSKFNMILHHYS